MATIRRNNNSIIIARSCCAGVAGSVLFGSLEGRFGYLPVSDTDVRKVRARL